VPPLSLPCSRCGRLWLSPHEWCGPCRALGLAERIKRGDFAPRSNAVQRGEEGPICVQIAYNAKADDRNRPPA
jgi:hypothetical protein